LPGGQALAAVGGNHLAQSVAVAETQGSFPFKLDQCDMVRRASDPKEPEPKLRVLPRCIELKKSKQTCYFCVGEGLNLWEDEQ
jgi:hypothetical protein